MRSFVICFFVFLASCATTHPGMKTVSNKTTDLVVSIDERKDLSDDFYAFFEYTFENKSEDWKSAQVISVNIGEKPTEVLVNDMLSSWIEGAELKLKKRNFNTGQDLNQSIRSASSGIKGENLTVNVPSTYLIAPFKISPKSYIKRWVIIKKPKGGFVKSKFSKPTEQENGSQLNRSAAEVLGKNKYVLISDNTGTKFTTLIKVNDKTLNFSSHY